MSTLLSDWRSHCTDIVRGAEGIFRTEVRITEKGFADPQFLALALLARTISNMKGAVILLDARRIVEARTITRSCFENLYWTIGLAEQGDAFAIQMRDDELTHRKARGQALFASEIKLDEEIGDRLRQFMRGMSQRNFAANTLSPKAVAGIRKDFERTYIFYAQLSSDAAHPSVSALNRYVVSDPNGSGFDTEPPVHPEEIAETYEFLSMACIGVCVAVNEIIGGAQDLTAVADRHTALSNATAAIGAASRTGQI
jgi:hypothetical protein